MERSVARKFDISRTEARAKIEVAKLELRGTSPSPQALVDRVGQIIAREAREAELAERPIIEIVSLLILPGGTLSLSREMVPRALAKCGVSGDEWAQLVDSITDGWALMLTKAKAMDAKTVKKIKKCEVVPSIIDYECFQQVYANAHATSSVSVFAANALALANFLLNPHGILVQLIMSEADQLGAEFVLPGGLEMTAKITRRNPTSPHASRASSPVHHGSPTRHGSPVRQAAAEPAYNPDYNPEYNPSNPPVVFVSDEDVIRC